MTGRKLKKKAKQEKVELELSLGETFEVGDAKEGDFELSLDNSSFRGAKGQAGTRTRGVD